MSDRVPDWELWSEERSRMSAADIAEHYRSKLTQMDKELRRYRDLFAELEQHLEKGQQEAKAGSSWKAGRFLTAALKRLREFR